METKRLLVFTRGILSMNGIKGEEKEAIRGINEQSPGYGFRSIPLAGCMMHLRSVFLNQIEQLSLNPHDELSEVFDLPSNLQTEVEQKIKLAAHQRSGSHSPHYRYQSRIEKFRRRCLNIQDGSTRTPDDRQIFFRDADTEVDAKGCVETRLSQLPDGLGFYWFHPGMAAQSQLSFSRLPLQLTSPQHPLRLIM